MCRLYAMQATEPTRVECSLVLAQNALMTQSRGDREGLVHGHGWGVADYPDGMPMVEKQVWAAYQGEHFAKKAAKVYARTVIAHVRRATVGVASPENTHPFHHGRWIFAHNGTVPHFNQVRERMLEAMDFIHRSEIHGETDSEHVFRYLLTLWQREPARDLLDILHDGVMQVVAWCREIDADARIGLNLVLTDGDRLVGSRLGRTLWYLERDGLVTCSICGKTHVHHGSHEDYRVAEIASETLTDEAGWKSVPDATVYTVDPDFRVRFRPLEV